VVDCILEHIWYGAVVLGRNKQKIRQTKSRGQAKVADVFTLAMLTVNFGRLPKLFAVQSAFVCTG